MRILYITSLWTGLKDIVVDGVDEPKGMPAFIRPLKKLIELGHHIDLFIIHDEIEPIEYKINVGWLNRNQIVGDVYWEKSLLKKISNAINLRNKISNILEKESYDFVYAHGYSAEPARKIVIEKGIPFGHRLYGTFLYDTIKKKGVTYAKIFRFLECSVFMTQKKFLLVTNDGSNGDKVYKLLNKKKNNFDFHFWHNGTDFFACDLEQAEIEKNEELSRQPFLFYLARIDYWKRQDYAIKILKDLHDNGYQIKLYIAGHIFNETYYNELLQLIDEYDLSEYVEFMGPINKNQINQMSKLAVSSFSLYEMCNLGNVFFELLSSGAVIISRNDGSLDEFIDNGENGFLIENVEDATNRIIDLLKNPKLEEKIRKNAIATSQDKVMSWEERIDLEIELITKGSKKT